MTKPSVQPVKPLSLRLVLIVPFVVQIFAAVGLVGYLSFRNGQKAVNELALRLQNEVTDTPSESLRERVDQHLDGYFNTARHLAEVNGNAFDIGLLNPEDLEQLGHYFWTQMQQFNVGYISFGKKSGEFASSGRFFEDRITVSERSYRRNNDWKERIYDVDKQGNRQKIAVVQNYDFSGESWYVKTVEGGKPRLVLRL